MPYGTGEDEHQLGKADVSGNAFKSLSFVSDRMRLRATSAREGGDVRVMMLSSACQGKEGGVGLHYKAIAKRDHTLSCSEHSSSTGAAATVLSSCSCTCALSAAARAPACTDANTPKCIWIAAKMSAFNRMPVRLMPWCRANSRISGTVDDMSIPLECFADVAPLELKAREKAVGAQQRARFGTAGRSHAALNPTRARPNRRAAIVIAGLAGGSRAAAESKSGQTLRIGCFLNLNRSNAGGAAPYAATATGRREA